MSFKLLSVFSLLTLLCQLPIPSAMCADKVASKSGISSASSLLQPVKLPPANVIKVKNKLSSTTPVAAMSSGAGNYPVFFVTNRLAKEKRGETKYTNSRSTVLSFGEYKPNGGEEKIDGSKLKRFGSEREFLQALKATGSSKVAFFVHGYRKSFEGSMDFGLKMAKHLDAPLVVFAWPSKNNYCAYMIDECTAEWSSHQLATMLGDLGDSIGYQNLVIVSHSLGARMVHWALRDLYTERRPVDQFAAALFFSPDMDRDSFLQDAKFLKRACADCRVYMGSHDTRIRISRFLHGSPRVGSGNRDQAEVELSQIFRYDDSLPSHQIPFDLVSASVHQVNSTSTRTTENPRERTN